MAKPRLLAAALTAPFLVVACTAGDDVTTDDSTPADHGDPSADPAARFTPITAPTVNLPPSMTTTDVVVMLELAADPVTVVAANAAVPMTANDKHSYKQVVTQLQMPVVQAVGLTGATVLGTYQSAYNGVKVRAARNQLATLAQLPGVIAVHGMALEFPTNTHGVPLVGAPAVWDGVAGIHGEGIKVAVIDTGIDYTHADFGGPGTADAYTTAHAAEAASPDPALVGPGAPRIKGGIDLAGDAYNGSTTPTPDDNPLDCNGHGSHVAGTIGGNGVLADGTTYTGSYDASTIGGNSWTVGPGVAPKVDLYAVRVFGCTGGTNLTVDGIEWAVDNDMDVINMSLGSAYGTGTDPSAVAASNAAAAGVIVVASAGNNGTNPYLTGSPASGSRVISVAAMDPITTVPGSHVALGTGPSVDAINANGITLPDGTVLPVVVLKTPTGAISLGCDPAEYTAANVTGKLVVTKRGTCARVARAIFGQQAGAAAVLMVNNANVLPPYEGPITQNPDTGVPYTVTIPFLGVSLAAQATMLAADGSTATLTNFSLPGAGMASFTSGGARTGDSFLKPDVTGPGVAIVSAANGTGNGGVAFSGTSMASPHTAGVAALVRQAHPTWTTSLIKSAIVNTADRTVIPAGYTVRTAGGGLVQVPGAVATNAVAALGDGTTHLNYGFAELVADRVTTKNLKVTNKSGTAMTFDLSVDASTGSPHTVTFAAPQVTVGPNTSTTIGVTLTVPAATAQAAGAFADVAGLVKLTPVGGANNGVALRVPYYFVPHSVAKIAATVPAAALNTTGTATSTITNPGGVITGSADYYAWGIKESGETASPIDVKAVGVESFIAGTANDIVVFALNTTARWSGAGANEYDVYVDVNGDGVDDYDVVEYDAGILLNTGAYDGRPAVAVITLATSARSVLFLATAPPDTRTMLLPVRVSQLCVAGQPCLSASNPRLTYHVVTFGRDGSTDTVAGSASYNPWTPALTTGQFAAVAPGASTTVTLSVNRTEFALTPALGYMIVARGNAGASETLLKGYVPSP